MFNEDDTGNVLLLPSSRPVQPDHVAHGMTVLKAAPHRPFEEDSQDEAPLTVEEIDQLLASFTEVEADEVPTLRDLLLEAEAHPTEGTVGTRVSSGIRRLRERRVNRTLNIISDWLLTLMVASQEEAATGTWTDNQNLFLVELAEAVRSQVAWPEVEAHQAAVDLARQAQEMGT